MKDDTWREEGGPAPEMLLEFSTVVCHPHTLQNLCGGGVPYSQGRRGLPRMEFSGVLNWMVATDGGGEGGRFGQTVWGLRDGRQFSAFTVAGTSDPWSK